MSTRNERTIYVRPCLRTVYGMGTYYFEAFIKARGEGAIVGGVTREDAIRAGSEVLWAIDKWGPNDWKNHGPIDAHPDLPSSFDYPIVDEAI
jgi:hypothetical protein